MLVVSDTSFCSNNLKNVCFIFKTKFCWHSLDAAVEILSLFLKEKNPAWPSYSTAAEQKVTALVHWVYSPARCSSGFLVSTHFLLRTSLPSLTQICSGIRTSKGLHKLSFPWWCTWQPRTIQTKTRLSLNVMDFHREFWRPESTDNLLTISKGLMCKMCEQLTLVTSYISIYRSNHWANELTNCSTPSRSERFVEGHCKTPTDAFEPQIKTQVLKEQDVPPIFFFH